MYSVSICGAPITGSSAGAVNAKVSMLKPKCANSWWLKLAVRSVHQRPARRFGSPLVKLLIMKRYMRLSPLRTASSRAYHHKAYTPAFTPKRPYKMYWGFDGARRTGRAVRSVRAEKNAGESFPGTGTLSLLGAASGRRIAARAAVPSTPFPKSSMVHVPSHASTVFAHVILPRLCSDTMAGMMRGNGGGRLGMMQPPVILLKEGTDTSQGTGQLLSNIGACLSIVACVSSTLGPRGMDKMIVNDRGQATISNDGATIMKLLDIVHPAARTLVDIARAQDAEVGDGTTSVVLLAGELLKESRQFIEEGVSPHVVAKGIMRASELAVARVKELAVHIDKGNPEAFNDLLLKCAGTAMSSKLIVSQRPFFAQMAVDAVQALDQEDLNEKMIGIKMVPGGAMQDSLLIRGVAFKKTFAYAGFEQQPKSFVNPKILCLNVELELKAEKDNAEVRINEVSEYQAIVDAEWSIIYNKLEAIVATGAKVVLSKLPIGDLATQYFADRDIFCAGRVPHDDLQRVVQAVGGSVQSTVSDIDATRHLGSCEQFEERQIGGERFNIFTGCVGAKTATIVLRGGAEQLIAEIERSLHDAIMIVKRAVQNNDVVAGGGAIEMELSKHLREHARTIQGKQQLIIAAYAKALECIPRQLADNAGFDATDLMNQLRMRHAQGHIWDGIDVTTEGVSDNMQKFVWEPALIKINALSSSAEAARVILSIDETINAQQSEKPNPGPPAPPGTAQRALRGGGLPRR